MTKPYLEVTYHQGHTMAAYLYLPRQSGEKSFRSTKTDPGLVIDFNQNGKPIGIEITAPEKVSITALNRVLRSFGLDPIKRLDLAPLRAA